MRSNYEKTEKNSDIFSEAYASIINAVISFFTILLILVFPLIYNNSYIDILVIKYQFYWGCVVVMLALCLVLSIIMLVIDSSKNGGERTKLFFFQTAAEELEENILRGRHMGYYVLDYSCYFNAAIRLFL
jgi:hypothetical protein